MHMRWYKTTTAVALLLMTLSSLSFGQQSRTVTVTGEGSLELTPDMAVFETGVVTEATTASDALRTNSESAAAVLSLLKQQGIDAKDIQTVQINVSPRYPQRNRQQEQERKIIGYTATNRMSIRVRQMQKLGAILDAVVRSGSNEVSGIRFDISDKSVPLDEARKEAVKDARKRAELYAEAAGVTLGQVLSIQESGTSDPPSREMGRAMMMATSVPVAAGQMSLSSSVQMTFELE